MSLGIYLGIRLRLSRIGAAFTGFFIKTESGDDILLEDGSRILMEG